MPRLTTISLELVDNLAVDEHEQLYRKGQKIRTSLPRTIEWSAVLIALGTSALAGIALADSPAYRALFEAIHHWVT